MRPCTLRTVHYELQTHRRFWLIVGDFWKTYRWLWILCPMKSLTLTFLPKTVHGCWVTIGATLQMIWTREILKNKNSKISSPRIGPYLSQYFQYCQNYMAQRVKNDRTDFVAILDIFLSKTKLKTFYGDGRWRCRATKLWFCGQKSSYHYFYIISLQFNLFFTIFSPGVYQCRWRKNFETPRGDSLDTTNK